MSRGTPVTVIAFIFTLFWGSTAVSAADAVGCAEVKIAVQPNVAMPGETIRAFAGVANCGKRWDFFKVALQLRRDGEKRLIGSWSFRLGPGMARELATKFEAPKPGEYVVTLIAKSRRGGHDGAAAKLLVRDKSIR